MFGCHRSTISRLFYKYRRTGRLTDLERNPRGRVTTRQQDQDIVTNHLQDRFKTAISTARVTHGQHGRPISRTTVLRRLRQVGIQARRPFRGLVLTPRHRENRDQWARQHRRMTRAEWANVLFTDESRFNLHHNDGRARVYRRRGERLNDACVYERDHYGGGSVMVWAGISLHSKTDLVVVQGNLNAARYQHEILLPFAIPHLRAAGRGMMLLQDGAPAHTARATQALLQNQNIRLLPLPAKSPDLNVIEHMWDALDRRVRNRPAAPQNLRELEQALVEEWANIPQAFIRNYVNSMRQRCEHVVRANGGHTRY